MWHKLQEKPPYFLLTTQKNGYEVYVTDYVTIWFVYFTNDSFLACLQVIYQCYSKETFVSL